MEIKKAVLFSKDLSGVGGGERLLFGFAKYLKEKGIETTILTFSFDKNKTFEGIAGDIEVVCLGSYSNKNSFFKKIFLEIPNIFRLAWQLRKIYPQIIITDGASNASTLYFSTLFSDIKYIVHIYETEFWFGNPDDTVKYASAYKKVFDEIRNSVIGHKEFIPANPPQMGFFKEIANNLVADIKNKALTKASLIFTLSKQMAWEVKKMYGKDAIVAKGAFPKELLQYKARKDIKSTLGIENKKMILSVSRLIRKKRIDLLIKSFSLIKDDQAVLVVGGSGPEEINLKNLSTSLGINEKVIFTGRIDEKDMYDYFASCDVFAYPDHADFGITPYEALALKKNVVWTSENEIDDYLKTNKRIFSADPNPSDFSKALELALCNKIDDNFDMSDYCWDRYFSKIYSAIELCLK